MSIIMRLHVDKIAAVTIHSIGFILFLITLPGTLEILFLTTSALLCRAKKRSQSIPISGKLAVIIPAHNEEKSIGSTIESIKNSDPHASIVVIADNCTDNTAAIAKEHNARVIERVNANDKGKPAALQYAFNILLKESFDWFVVVDADSLVKKNFIEEVLTAFKKGSDAMQTRYDVRNPTASLRHRLMNIAFLAFNNLRLMGRANLGLSCGILGNGFGLSRQILEIVPFDVKSVVEDLSYHLKIVQAGYKVDFIPSTSVYGEIPSKGKGVATQRIRWEGGRLTEICTQIGPLLKKIFLGSYRLLEPAMELLLLPLAYHVFLLLILLTVFESFIRFYAGISLIAVMYYLAAAIWLGGGGIKDFAALFFAPFYIIWTLGLFFRLIPKIMKGLKWEKTERQ